MFGPSVDVYRCLALMVDSWRPVVRVCSSWRTKAASLSITPGRPPGIQWPGTLSAVGLCVLIYRLGYRLDFRVFFRVMGILLLFFAAGLLSDAVQNMQQLGWITFGTTALWNTSHILSEGSTLGDLLHGIIGYAEAPTVLQVIFYTTYLVIVGSIFTWMTRKPRTGKPVTSSISAANKYLHSRALEK